jgi:hypothetical protein
MKQYTAVLTAVLCATLAHAQPDVQLALTYGHLDFDHSVKKDKGERYGMKLDWKTGTGLYQIAYEKTDTRTFKPPLGKNLHVNKYYLKYTYALDEKQAFHFSYATIDDNLMKETDSGHIYGMGYRYGAWDLTQYISDYRHFNVYQTDMKYTYGTDIGAVRTSVALIGKYIHLQNRESNSFSKNAKADYFTPGIKLHAHYGEYHFGAGAFFGKRIFAVMDNGFRVQHHAMEFDETYMAGLGKHFGPADLTLKYVYQSATEVPINNKNVKVKNVMLQLRYHF